LNVPRRRGFESRVPFEEIGWPELKCSAQQWHYREVFLRWNMTNSHDMPHHNVLVLYVSVPAIISTVSCCRHRHALIKN